MNKIARRGLILGGTGILGLGVVYGGSLAACSSGTQVSGLFRPLYAALNRAFDRNAVGEALLREASAAAVAEEVSARSDLMSAALAFEDKARAEQLEEIVRDEFARGDTLCLDRWVVARSEGLLAAAACLDPATA